MKVFWLVSDPIFGALGRQQVANKSAENNAKIGIEKSSFRGRPTPRNFGELGGRREVRGEVILHPGVGGSEERKKEERKKGKKEGKED